MKLANFLPGFAIEPPSSCKNNIAHTYKCKWTQADRTRNCRVISVMIPDCAAHRETTANVGSNDLHEPVPSLVQLFYRGCYVVF